MILTQKNRLKLNKVETKIVSKLCYHSARLYNVGLYSVRQHYLSNNQYLSYPKNYHACKNSDHYKLLLTDSGQQILKIVERDMKSFFGLLRLKKQSKYSSEIKLPRYKKPESLAIICVQGRAARIKKGYVHIGLSKAFKEIYQPQMKELVFRLPPNIKVKKLQEVRIIPKFHGKEFDIEFIYRKEIEPNQLTKGNYLTLDLGLDNLVTTFNSTTGASFIIDGRYIKSVNQWYNRQKARLQGIKDRQGLNHFTNRMIRLERKREFRINDYFNRTVKRITDYCMTHDIGSIVVGDFSNIKQEINLGKRNNQNFVQIPYRKLRQKLQSKCQQTEIDVYNQIEEYTSKTSFLDQEIPQKSEIYQGKRVKRGLFRTSEGILVNADVNGAAQILIKHLLKSKPGLIDYQRWSSGFVNNPVRFNIYKAN